MSSEVQRLLREAAELQDSGRTEEALERYRRILEVDSDNAEALLCLAVLREDADVEEARRYMDRYVARREHASGRLRRALMLPAIADSVEHIDRVTRRLEAELDEITASSRGAIRQPEFEVGATPFFLAYYGRNAKPLLEKVARACRHVYPTQTECRRKLFASGARLRIGFISTHFHEHSVSRALYGFIHDLPRKRFEVQVFAIAPREDAWNARIRASAERYAALPLDLETCRQALSDAKLDIAFFMDIGMDPLTYFLAFWRLAPLQVATWGHSVTSGIDTIDYYVSHDRVEIPEAQAHYTEKLIRLPGYFMPRYLKPPLPAPEPRRQGTRSYHCPQNLFKLHPDFDAAMKAILERDPQGEIVLVDSGRPWTGQLRSRLRRSLGALSERVRIVPRMTHEQYLRHLSGADVVLDPFHFGGCNSSCDAFALGIPVVTLPGFLLPGRFTLGLYGEMGVEGAIASSPEAYAHLAWQIAREPDALRTAISRNSDRLFERPDCGRALGEALLRIAEERR